MTRKLTAFLKSTSLPPHPPLPFPLALFFVFVLFGLGITQELKLLYSSLTLSKTMFQRYAQIIQVKKDGENVIKHLAFLPSVYYLLELTTSRKQIHQILFSPLSYSRSWDIITPSAFQLQRGPRQKEI